MLICKTILYDCAKCFYLNTVTLIADLPSDNLKINKQGLRIPPNASVIPKATLLMLAVNAMFKHFVHRKHSVHFGVITYIY